MLACAGLILWGYRAGAYAVPAIILLGLIGMRGVMWGLHPNVHELAAFPLWLCVAVFLMYKGAWLAGALCLLSGATYPALLVVGARIEYLGLSPIIADAFLIAAIVVGGHGVRESVGGRADLGRSLDGICGAALRMAEGEDRGA